MTALDEILTDVRDTAMSRLMAGQGAAPWDAGRDAEDRAIAAVAAGTITADHLSGFLAGLRNARMMGVQPHPEVLIALMGVVARAATLAGDTETAREAAREHAQATIAVTRATGDGSLGHLAGRSLDIVTTTGLAESDPDLVADLHLEAGNRFMRPGGPTSEQVYRGLGPFTAAYRLKVRAGSPDAPRLADTLRGAARFTLDMAELAGAMSMGGGPSGAELRAEAALDAFAALGDEAGQRAARLLLARHLVGAHRGAEAEPHLAHLATDPGLSTRERTELALLRADHLTGSERAAEALRVVDGVLLAGPLAGGVLADGAPADGAPADSALAAVMHQGLRWYGLTIRANALRLLGREPEAADAFRTLAAEVAAHLADRPGDVNARGRLSNAEAHLGLLACRAGDLPEARRHIAGALEAVGELQKVERLEIHRLAADAFWDADALEDAVPHLDSALSLLGDLVSATSDPARRQVLRGQWARLEQRRAETLARSGEADPALEMIEGTKARELRRILDAFGGDVAAVPPDLAAAHRTLRATATELEAYLARLNPIDPAARAAGIELAGLRQRADALVEAAEREIVTARSASSAPLAEVLEGGQPRSAAATADRILGQPAIPTPADHLLRHHTPATADHLHPRPATTSALLSYLATAGGTGAVVRREGTTTVRWLPTPYEEIAPVVKGLARDPALTGAAGAWEEALDARLARLGTMLIDPVADLLDGVGELLVVPHRGLHAIPWSCVGGRATPLLDRVGTLSVVPSVLLAGALADRRRRPGAGALLVARPDARAPLTGLEADAVAGILGETSQVRDDDADPFRVAAASAGATTVHLACHGVWEGGDQGSGHLQLAPPPPDGIPVFGTGSGHLGVPAVLGLFDLRAADAVVLSACETGLARADVSDEPLGLPLALLAVGARWVVASLWSVRDASTLLLMTEFHRRLAGGDGHGDGGGGDGGGGDGGGGDGGGGDGGGHDDGGRVGHAVDPRSALAGAQRWLRSLGRDEAAARLDAVAGNLEGRLPPRLLPLARTQLVLPPGDHPFHHPDHWGAFTCFGAPHRSAEEDR